jgi:hypothetical protein
MCRAGERNHKHGNRNVKLNVFRKEYGIWMENTMIFYDKINSNTCATPPYHSVGLPCATINIKPVTNLTNEL